MRAVPDFIVRSTHCQACVFSSYIHSNKQ